jgi:putative ABC transport system permease protein
MKLDHALTTAFKALSVNTSRSVLTMVGIIIGISSVIIVLSVGASAQNLILDQVRGIGSDLIAVLPGESDESGPPVSVLGITVTTLKNQDIEDIVNDQALSEIIAGVGYVQGSETIMYQGELKRGATYLGVGADFMRVEETQLVEGRFFTLEEQESLTRVAVLGYQLAEDLFADQEPLGERIKIGNEFFTVIGVFEERGAVAFQSPDDTAYIPLDTAQKRLLNIDYLNFARFKVAPDAQVASVIDPLEQLLRELHDIQGSESNDFSIRTTDQALGILTTITDAVKFFLSAVAAISLLVGGVGIMNIMFVAITERTQEIGLRKAIGADSKDIITQFVFESSIISLMGGVLGVLVGIGVSFIIALAVNASGFEWEFIITLNALILSVVFSIAIGLIFGLYPAYAASRLNPIEALRYE